MSTVRFGLRCDRCSVTHDNYDVGDIRECEDCQLDLCGLCAAATLHVAGREGCCPECASPSWVEVEVMPLADAICDAETLQSVASSLADEDDAAYGIWTLMDEASVINIFSERWSPTRCAHAAFRAVPELRS